jgi:hypothetical protein
MERFERLKFRVANLVKNKFNQKLHKDKIISKLRRWTRQRINEYNNIEGRHIFIEKGDLIDDSDDVQHINFENYGDNDLKIATIRVELLCLILELHHAYSSYDFSFK